MARYKTIDTSPRFLAVDLEQQLIPGTFVHALNHLIDHGLDLSAFDRSATPTTVPALQPTRHPSCSKLSSTPTALASSARAASNAPAASRSPSLP